MRTLYLVTHAEATHHLDRIVGGWHDSSLTAAGVRAAGHIAIALRSAIPAAEAAGLWTSDLRRTAQTAAVIGAALGVVPVADRRLREKSYGEAEGRPQEWLDERFIPPPASGDRLHHQEGVAGAETRCELAGRIYAAMDDILAAGPDRQVVVTHGFAGTMAVAWWIGMPAASTGSVSFALRSGSITELHEDDFFHNRAVTRLGDTTHLA